MRKISPSNLLQAGFAALVLLATAWLLWPWQGDNEPAAFFLPTATTTPTRVVVHRMPTPTTFVPTATPQPVIHVVQSGEVLGIIAQQYGTSVEAIMEANGLKDANLISIGQELVIAGAKRTPIVTVVSTPTPTSTPTSPFRYSAPPPIAPRDGEVFHGPEARIHLSWMSVAILEEAEWYEVKLWAQEKGEARALRFWTKASSWLVPASLYPAEGSGLFYWKVSIVRRTRTPQSLSPAGGVRRFYWY